MKREVHRVVRTLLAAAVLLGASFGLAALETGEAFAYSYRTTDTKTIYNRAWIRADASANYLELIGSDPIGPRFDMPSWNAPGGIHSRIEAYRFAVWSAANGSGRPCLVHRRQRSLDLRAGRRDGKRQARRQRQRQRVLVHRHLRLRMGRLRHIEARRVRCAHVLPCIPSEYGLRLELLRVR